jgi:sugar phosphate isomerase/epimerase
MFHYQNPRERRRTNRAPVRRCGRRGWIFRTCGYGHGAGWWTEFISTLRIFGYDYVLSIEHEDSLLSPEEGLTKAAHFLNGIVIREQPGAAWWVKGIFTDAVRMPYRVPRKKHRNGG